MSPFNIRQPKNVHCILWPSRPPKRVQKSCKLKNSYTGGRINGKTLSGLANQNNENVQASRKQHKVMDQWCYIITVQCSWRRRWNDSLVSIFLVYTWPISSVGSTRRYHQILTPSLSWTRAAVPGLNVQWWAWVFPGRQCSRHISKKSSDKFLKLDLKFH